MYWNERNVGCCFPIRIFLEHTGKNVAEMGIAFVWGNLVPDEYCGIQFLWKKEKSTSGNWQTLTHVSVYSFHYSNNNLFLLHGSLYSLLPRLWGHKFYQSMPRVSLWASLVAQLVKKIHLQCRRPQFNSWVRKIRWRRDRLPVQAFLGFPSVSAGKESTCNAGDLGLIPGLGRSPGEGKGYPLQYSGLENSMDGIGVSFLIN